MIRGRLFVGAVLLTGAMVWTRGASPAATAAGGFLGSGGFPFAADLDGGFDDALRVGDRFQIWALATRVDVGSFFGGPAADDVDTTENAGPIPTPSVGFTSASAGDVDSETGESAAASTVIDVKPMLSPPEDFQTVSNGVSIDPVEDLVPAPGDATDATSSTVADDDILIEDTVPALAALGLVSAGLLLVGLVRRRRRTAQARRVKRSFDRMRRSLRR